MTYLNDVKQTFIDAGVPEPTAHRLADVIDKASSLIYGHGLTTGEVVVVASVILDDALARADAAIKARGEVRLGHQITQAFASSFTRSLIESYAASLKKTKESPDGDDAA